jgi:hypothetical protein
MKARIMNVDFPWQCLWIIIIIYLCCFSSLSTKWNEHWQFCWEAKKNSKREGRGDKKHCAWVREKTIMSTSNFYRRQKWMEGQLHI